MKANKARCFCTFLSALNLNSRSKDDGEEKTGDSVSRLRRNRRLQLYNPQETGWRKTSAKEIQPPSTEAHIARGKKEIGRLASTRCPPEPSDLRPRETHAGCTRTHMADRAARPTTNRSAAAGGRYSGNCRPTTSDPRNRPGRDGRVVFAPQAFRHA